MAECGYCYARLNVKDMPPLHPGELDWKAALYQAAESGEKNRGVNQWLLLLGDPKAIIDYMKFQNELWSQWKTLTAQARAAMEGDATEAQLQALVDAFSTMPEKAEARSWVEKLAGKLAAERTRRRLADIRERASRSNSVEELDACLMALNGLEDAPGASALADELRLRIETLRQEEQRRRERIARRIKFRKIRRFAILAACVLALIGYSRLSIHVLQPRRLARARELAANGTFEAAEAAYLAAGRGGLFPNESVRVAVYEELKALRSKRAAELEAAGEYESALNMYKTVGDSRGETRVTLAWAAALEADGAYAEAIKLLERLPDTEDRVKALYAKWTLRLVSEENYERAVETFAQADQQLLADQGVTELSLREAWCGQAMAGDNLRAALAIITPVREEASVSGLYRELQYRLMDEELAAEIAAWQAADEPDRPAALERVRKSAMIYTEIDAQLRVWQMADRAGIDLTALYPEGVVVTGLMPPENILDGEAQVDTSKPLVILRRERDYDLSLSSNMTNEVRHDPASESSFTLIMSPIFWQALPPERRAETLADCTSVALVNLTYAYIGNVSGSYIIWDYISMYSEGKKKPTNRLYFPKSYMCFDALHEVLLWEPGASTAYRTAHMTNRARYSPNAYVPGSRGPTVDWTEHTLSIPYADVGLSGTFDKQWIEDRLNALYAELR